jgi:hypothetical protein
MLIKPSITRVKNNRDWFNAQVRNSSEENAKNITKPIFIKITIY